MRTLGVLLLFLAASAAQAGVVGVVVHLSKDAYHIAKYQVVGVVHAVKHVGKDAKTTVK